MMAITNQVYLEDQRPPIQWATATAPQFFEAHARFISCAVKIQNRLLTVAEEYAARGVPLPAAAPAAPAAEDRQGAMVRKQQKRERRQRRRAAAQANAPQLVPADAEQPVPAAPNAEAAPNAAVELVSANCLDH